MKYAIAMLVVPIFFVTAGISYCNAQSYAAFNPDSAAQSLGSRSLAAISRANRYGIDTSRAMRYQAEGDEALHRGNVVRAAEDYGRAEEAIRVLQTERQQAVQERRIDQRELDRARRLGTYNLAPAEIDFQHGLEALQDGDYITAQMYFAEARASLAVGS